MTPRALLPLLAVLVPIAIAGCGGGGGSSSSSDAVAPSTAKSTVEQAAGVKLATFPVPADAKKEGLQALYSNSTSFAGDKQIVFVFDVKDSDTLNKLKGSLLNAQALQPAGVKAKLKILTHKNIAVVYGAIGNDHYSDVSAAVNKL
jgi:hypothetical protein